MYFATTPFSPRKLTKSEFDNEDVHTTARPGRDDAVELVGPLRLAQWLLLIFDPSCYECIERPRQLTLYTDAIVELDFWTRHRDGSEMFWFLVPEKDMQNGPTGRVFRDATLWADAAMKTGITLNFVHENHVLQKSQRVANFFRMLPHAQASYHLPERALLRDRIAEVFTHRQLPMTFEQIEGSLRDIDRASVRSSLCGFIYEGAVTFEADLPLSDRTILTWKEAP